MLTLYTPSLKDMVFRQRLLADEQTMAYNKAYGGTIPFPKEKWESWYSKWVNPADERFFYRYLHNKTANEFVGETAYHYDESRGIFLCDMIVLAKHRGKGFGTLGLKLLCEAAKSNNISALYDDIAVDNPSVELFLRNGFNIEYKTAEIVMVKKVL